MQIDEWMLALLPGVASALGVWVRMSNELTQLRTRVQVLEQERGESRRMLREVHEAVQEIRVTLAKKGI